MDNQCYCILKWKQFLKIKKVKFGGYEKCEERYWECEESPDNYLVFSNFKFFEFIFHQF